MKPRAGRRRWAARARLLGGLLTVALAACDEPCCTFDSEPIPLTRAAMGELLTLVAEGDTPGPALPAVVDTASPVTFWRENPPANVRQRTLRVVSSGDGGAALLPIRAIFRGVTTVGASLGAVGSPEMALAPGALLGGDFLSVFSVEIGFGRPEMTFWPSQPASSVFLSSVGYAVLHVDRRGGGQLEALGPSVGPRGPHQYPPSLLVLRACAVPTAFVATDALPDRCCPGDERALASGVDLSLALGTGVGPLVLGRSAWERVRQALGTSPVLRPGPLLVATSATPLAAEWTTLPRLALVDREADLSADPGPCVELGRARRLEQIAFRQAQSSDSAACALPCDSDAKRERAQNAAGYLELGGEIAVAVIDDRETILQTLRQESRPEGPEVAGIIGAGVLRHARVELDYPGQPARAIFSCEREAPTGSCRAVGRCPRLTGGGQTRSCFGLPPHGLPRMCDNRASSCQ